MESRVFLESCVQLRERLEKMLRRDEIECFFDALERLSRAPSKACRLNPRVPGTLEAMERALGKTLGRVPWHEDSVFLSKEDRQALSHFPMLEAAGLVFLQEPSAVEVAPQLDLQESQWLLDYCAAPGAKASQVLETLPQGSFLVAHDINRSRAEKLSLLLARHGGKQNAVYSCGAETLRDAFEEGFDRVLLDAPCSSESFFAKRREKRKDVSHREVKRFARMQEKALEDAATLVAEGGRLVYSTCTYSSEENEEQIQKFLRKHSSFALAKEQRRWPHIDKVPGGYFAVLRKSGVFSAKHYDKSFAKSERGLLRWESKRFDQSQDVFAFAKSQDCQWPMIELNDSQAKSYLSGAELPCESAVPEGFCRVSWRGEVLGPVKHSKHRLKNHYPKPLRLRFA